MKVLITGADGQLGFDVTWECRRRGHETYPTNRAVMDITDGQMVKAVLDRVKPHTVIHCAAYTAVDLAQSERHRCYTANVKGTGHIVRECKRNGVTLLYVSTDYVFLGDGSRPNRITDTPKPINWYGRTKLMGEELVKSLPSYGIVRTGWLFGSRGQNFVNRLTALGKREKRVSVVNDEFGSPTYTKDLARLLLDMAERGSSLKGVYHACNNGFCSRFEFAQEIFRQFALPSQVIPVTSAEYNALRAEDAARRPLNGRLDQSELKRQGFVLLPDWKDALSRYREELERL